MSGCIKLIRTMLIIILTNACSESNGSLFQLKGEFTDEQKVLLEIAQDEWCESGLENNRDEEFCSKLDSDGESVFIGIFGIDNDYSGIHKFTAKHKDEQWASEIKIDTSLTNIDFYNFIKHEIGHHFCVPHISNKGIMEPYAGDWENTNITKEIISKGGCKL